MSPTTRTVRKWLLVTAAALAALFLTVTALPAHASVRSPARIPAVYPALTARTAQSPTWTVRSGQTLSAIAASAYGNAALWPALWWTNRALVKNPDMILTGQVLALSAWHPQAAWLTQAADKARGISAPSVAGTDGDGDHDGDTRDSSAPVVVSAPVTHAVGGGTLSYGGLEQLWISAGGNPGAAATAACIAEAESSGQQYATGPFGERGYWQINPVNGSLSTYDPYGNARAAIILSFNGTNWSAWTTAPKCGV